MKIANFIPHLSDGGAERVVSNNSINFSNEFEQFLILLKNEISYPYKGKLLTIKKEELIKIKENLDICISHMPRCNILNVKTKSKSCKTVLTVHTKLSDKFSKKIFHKFLVRKYYKKADMIVAVSESVKNDLINNFKIKHDKIFVFENAINIEKNITTKLDSFNLINVGRLVSSKAQDRLIDIMKIVNLKDKSIKLNIYGTGELLNYLNKKICENRLENVIKLRGYSNDILNEYTNNSLLISTSKIEGFGMSIVEAMSCGLPIISTTCAEGPRDIIIKDNKHFGILIDYNKDANEIIADEIIKFSKDSKYYDKYKNLSLERAKDFNIKIAIKKFEEKLRGL